MPEKTMLELATEKLVKIVDHPTSYADRTVAAAVDGLVTLACNFHNVKTDQ